MAPKGHSSDLYSNSFEALSDLSTVLTPYFILSQENACFLRVVQYTQTELDRPMQCTLRLTESQVVRVLEIRHVGLLPIHLN